MSNESASLRERAIAEVHGGGVTPAATAASDGAPHTSVVPEQPIVVNDADAVLASFRLRDLWAYRELLLFLTWRDIKVRYKQTAIGATWAIIQPLFIVFIFAVFFGLLVGVPTEGMPFVVFYFCGLLPWTFFSNAVTQSSMSLVSNANLITKVYFPRTIIPAAAVGAGLVDLLISSIILIGLATYYGLGLTPAALMLPVLIGLTVLLSLALGMWLAALTVKYRDVRHALPFVLQIWMFITPIIYPLEVVPVKWRWLMFLNPLTGIVEGMRSALMGRGFDWYALSFSAFVTLMLLFAAAYAFQRIERSFADLI
ncbi:MAG TPA: ABC transporter permease [Pyrinomonadaceae bacterium]|nr:ABC transporter permease [Pyrinomonadaceae bacterium]